MPKPTQQQKQIQEAIREIQEIDSTTATLKKRKADLKVFVIQSLFPRPVEGTNTTVLLDIKVNLKNPIDRKVDDAVFQTLYDDVVKHKVPVNDLVLWQPSLSLKVYRNLNKQQLRIFDDCITAKQGSQSLEFTTITK